MQLDDLFSAIPAEPNGTRGVVSDIIAWIDRTDAGAPVAMLLDHAGLGKSVVMRDIQDTLENRHVTVLAIKADQQLSGLTSAENLPSRLSLPGPVENVIDRLASLGPVVVLIDQVDSLSLSLARDQRTLAIVLDLVARLRLVANVHIVLSCRTFDYNGDPQLSRTAVGREFHLSPFSDTEVRNVLNEAGVIFDDLTPATQQLLRIPLHLDLFLRLAEIPASTTEHRRVLGGLVTLQQLYELLWSNIILRPDPDGPSNGERAEVLRLAIDRMHADQRTSVPKALFTESSTSHLERV